MDWIQTPDCAVRKRINELADMRYFGLFALMSLMALGCGAVTPRPWTLDSCISYALTHNISIRQADAQVQSARYDVTESKDRFLPEVSASVQQNFNFGRGLTAENTYANRNTNNFSAGVNMSVPLFQGLSGVRRVDYAKASLWAVVEEAEATRDNVALNILAAYLQSVYTSEMVRVARRQTQLSQDELMRRVDLAHAGKIAEIETEEARAQLAKDQLTEVTAVNDSVMALVELAAMLHLRDDGQFCIAPLADRSDSQLPPSALQVYDAALGRNHSLWAGRRKLDAAEKYVSLSQTGYIPRLSFNAGVGSSYYTVSGLSHEPFHTQMHNNFSTYVGFSLQIPVFDAFSTRNSVRKAKLNRLAAQLELETREDELYTAVTKAWQAAVNASRRLESARVAEDATYASMMAVQDKYSVGRATPFEFDTAKTQWMQAASERIQAQCELELRRRVLEFYSTGQR